ncbi:MAG: hypothetical protein MJ246_05495 [Clostridia bacterium]|nr:hypothetical protein [Clostridia bacterium]
MFPLSSNKNVVSAVAISLFCFFEFEYSLTLRIAKFSAVSHHPLPFSSTYATSVNGTKEIFTPFSLSFIVFPIICSPSRIISSEYFLIAHSNVSLALLSAPSGVRGVLTWNSFII